MWKLLKFTMGHLVIFWRFTNLLLTEHFVLLVLFVNLRWLLCHFWHFLGGVSMKRVLGVVHSRNSRICGTRPKKLAWYWLGCVCDWNSFHKYRGTRGCCPLDSEKTQPEFSAPQTAYMVFWHLGVCRDKW